MGRKEPKSLWEYWKIYRCSISKISDSILYCLVFPWQQSLGIQCCRLKLRAVQFWFLLVWFLALHQLVWSYPEAWWKMAIVSAWFGMVMVFYVIFNEDMQRSWLVVCSFAWIFVALADDFHAPAWKSSWFAIGSLPGGWMVFTWDESLHGICMGWVHSAWSLHPCVHELLSTSLDWWKMACGMARLGMVWSLHGLHVSLRDDHVVLQFLLAGSEQFWVLL